MRGDISRCPAQRKWVEQYVQGATYGPRTHDRGKRTGLGQFRDLERIGAHLGLSGIMVEHLPFVRRTIVYIRSRLARAIAGVRARRWGSVKNEEAERVP